MNQRHLPRVLLVILVNLNFIFSFSSAQIITKQLPEPKFYVFGISEKNFPKYEGNWEDTSSLKIYSFKVTEWLAKNKDYSKTIVKNKKTKIAIDYLFYKSLSASEKDAFKKVSKLMSYALLPQKQMLFKDFEAKNPNKKGNSKEFYNDSEQIYFLHEENLIMLKNRIRN
jgi:hypothetical protein